MPKSLPGAPVAAVVTCRISAKDVEAMDYWLNESPMADPTRQNAICFALKRLLPEGAEVCLRDESRSRVSAVVNGSVALRLPNELAGWWRRVLAGHRAQPVSALVEIPLDLLAPGLRAALREAEDRMLAHSWSSEVPKANAA